MAVPATTPPHGRGARRWVSVGLLGPTQTLGDSQSEAHTVQAEASSVKTPAACFNRAARPPDCVQPPPGHSSGFTANQSLLRADRDYSFFSPPPPPEVTGSAGVQYFCVTVSPLAVKSIKDRTGWDISARRRCWQSNEGSATQEGSSVFTAWVSAHIHLSNGASVWSQAASEIQYVTPLWLKWKLDIRREMQFCIYLLQEYNDPSVACDSWGVFFFFLIQCDIFGIFNLKQFLDLLSHRIIIHVQ